MKYKFMLFHLPVLLFTMNCFANDNQMSHRLGAVKEVHKEGRTVHIGTTDNKEVLITGMKKFQSAGEIIRNFIQLICKFSL